MEESKKKGRRVCDVKWNEAAHNEFNNQHVNTMTDSPSPAKCKSISISIWICIYICSIFTRISSVFTALNRWRCQRDNNNSQRRKKSTHIGSNILMTWMDQIQFRSICSINMTEVKCKMSHWTCVCCCCLTHTKHQVLRYVQIKFEQIQLSFQFQVPFTGARLKIASLVGCLYCSPLSLLNLMLSHSQ